jgi:hypothetical protein
MCDLSVVKEFPHLKLVYNRVGSILVPIGAFFDDNWLHFYCQNYHYSRVKNGLLPRIRTFREITFFMLCDWETKNHLSLREKLVIFATVTINLLVCFVCHQKPHSLQPNQIYGNLVTNIPKS